VFYCNQDKEAEAVPGPDAVEEVAVVELQHEAEEVAKFPKKKEKTLSMKKQLVYHGFSLIVNRFNCQLKIHSDNSKLKNAGENLNLLYFWDFSK
jgi:hypothetical protein